MHRYWVLFSINEHLFFNDFLEINTTGSLSGFPECFKWRRKEKALECDSWHFWTEYTNLDPIFLYLTTKAGFNLLKLISLSIKQNARYEIEKRNEREIQNNFGTSSNRFLWIHKWLSIGDTHVLFLKDRQATNNLV